MKNTWNEYNFGNKDVADGVDPLPAERDKLALRFNDFNMWK